MSNALTDIADGIKAELEAATLSQTFTVQRVYVPTTPLEEMAGVTLYVVGLDEKVILFGENTTRAFCEHQYTARIAIYAPASLSDTAGLDALSDFRQEVIDLFKTNRTLAGVQGASLLELTNSPTYFPDALEGKGLFATVIQLVYRLIR